MQMKAEKVSSNIEWKYGSSPVANILNSVFPEVVDATYVKLTNQLIQYADAVSNLDNKGSKLDKVAKEFDNDSRIRELELFKQIKDLISDESSLTPDIWIEMRKLADEGLATSKMKVVKEIGKSLENDDLSISKGESQELLDVSVLDISNTLKEINTFDSEFEKRIEEIKFTEVHEEQVDAIAGLTDVQRDELKEKMTAYTDMRVESFKIVEDFAKKTVSAYQRNETVSFAEDNDKYVVATTALSDVDSCFYERLGHTTDPIFDNDVYHEYTNIDIKAMKMITNFERTGFVDSNAALELAESGYAEGAYYDMLVSLSSIGGKMELKDMLISTADTFNELATIKRK